jgi:hypothetical protein
MPWTLILTNTGDLCMRSPACIPPSVCLSPWRPMMCIRQYASPPCRRSTPDMRHRACIPMRDASLRMHSHSPDASTPFLAMRPYGCILSLTSLSSPLLVMCPYTCILSLLSLRQRSDPLLVMRPHGCILSVPSLRPRSSPLLGMHPHSPARS